MHNHHLQEFMKMGMDTTKAKPISATIIIKYFSSKTNSLSCNKSTSAWKKFYPFDEASRLAREHGFSSVEEFLNYDYPGVYEVAKHSGELYPNEWLTWEDVQVMLLILNPPLKR